MSGNIRSKAKYLKFSDITVGAGTGYDIGGIK